MEPPSTSHVLLAATCAVLLGNVAGLVVYPRYAVYTLGTIAAACLVLSDLLRSLPGIVWLLVLLGLSALADTYMATLRTWYYRVSRDGIYGGLIGGIITIFLFQISAFGFLVGTFLGAIVGEMRTQRSVPVLLKLGLGATVGMYGPVCIKLMLGLAMVDAFVASASGYFRNWLVDLLLRGLA